MIGTWMDGVERVGHESHHANAMLKFAIANLLEMEMFVN